MARSIMISRRALLCTLGSLPLYSLTSAQGRFSYAEVISLAEQVAQHSYRPKPSVPVDWTDLTYDQYRTIWFRNADALWANTDKPYNVDFFLPGLYFPRPVKINTVTDGSVTPFPFDFGLFDKSDLAPSLTLDERLGYSGFRLRTEFEQPNIKEEFCVFQGASYFRAIGFGQVYGLSARGLALNVAAKQGEEFPEFTDFWLETPTAEQKTLRLYALLDSPSVTGAYLFDIIPGSSCYINVRATLFPRRAVSSIGFAPLTSMFLFDETNRKRFDDFRPAVHDSDGLMIQNGSGEVLWRPLANPKTLQISAFIDDSPRGFGLMQRSRRLEHFADLEAHYHRRPSLWVEPQGAWGDGSVILVEIPSDKEIYDNIVAYWQPRSDIPIGEPYELNYRLIWGEGSPIDSRLPRVMNTRMGKDPFHPGRIVAIDFEPHPIFDDVLDNMTIHIHSGQAETTSGLLQRHPETGGVRLSFRFDPQQASVAELRAQLRKDGVMASEVWLYRWTR
ncbi:MAG: glucan biosynthesis protein G [Aestuariivita sp.]|nr:glucan biosynthesis protein G [Aestuariivita sp.]MCY4201628.1 glucan biosynthesis protein G [Aestuariivita sp.]